MRCLYFNFFALLMLFSGNSFAVCENGSSIERLSCMREAFCPEASTVEERTACYQMITEALRSDRLADNQSSRSAQKKSEAQEVEKSNSEPEVASGQEAEVLAGEEKQETSNIEKDRTQEKRSDNNGDQKNDLNCLDGRKATKRTTMDQNGQELHTSGESPVVRS